MANDTFATFQEISGLGSTDYLVGYRNISETRINYNNLINTVVNNLTGFQAYSVVNQNSANWESTYNTVKSTSANWQGGNSAYTNLNTNSAFYGFISAVLYS